MLENKGVLRDIRELKINTGLSVTDRMKSFIKQVENPYIFSSAGTVVEIEYAGGRSFSEAVTNLLVSG